ncbi:MAG: TerC family protein [Deltaproteobacteria bacterium]|nr:TerC family protein [Deltaproteobacteria bacterium]
MESLILNPEALLALATLSAMEIVLGIDNIVFISILVAKVDEGQRERIRKLGLILALGIRLCLLFSISWIMGLTTPLLTVGSLILTGRHLILFGGGVFLIAKATLEIHDKLESPETPHTPSVQKGTNAMKVLIQILLLDIVFSLDSVITAVGMASQLWVMATAMIIAMGVMLVSARAIGDFILRHPTLKILALSFLLLIGVMLTAEGMDVHVSKGYIYFAMAFSLLVELLNLRLRKSSPIPLRSQIP